MSAAKASTAGLPRVARMPAAAASVRAGSRPVMPTRAPSAASPMAVALPMPSVPPVTRTVFPAMTGASAMVQSYPGGRPKAVTGLPRQLFVIGHAQTVGRSPFLIDPGADERVVAAAIRGGTLLEGHRDSGGAGQGVMGHWTMGWRDSREAGRPGPRSGR